MGKEAKVAVRLTIDERFQLEAIVANPKSAQDRALRARLLIKADADGPGWPDARIAEAFEVSVSTVTRLRQRCVFEGLEACLQPRPQPARGPKFDGAAEAQLVVLACSKPPEGRAKWTMQLLADRLVELKVVEAVSDETVRQRLKKTRCSLGASSAG